MLKFKKYINPATVFVFLLLTGWLIFANGLHNGFMVDDHAFFDEKMRNIKYLAYQFLPDKELSLGIEGRQTDSYYRPLAHIVPMLAFLVFGNNVVGYHALNIVLWAIAAWMLYIFLNALFDNAVIALMAAFLYMIHPINGVVVNYITADVFPVQIICMLAALWCCLTQKEAASFWHKGSCFLLAVVFFILAIMCHETAMFLPFYAMIILVVARGQKWLQALKNSLPLWMALGIYFLWRLKHASLSHSILDNYLTYHMSIFEYAATMGKLMWWYLSKLFYPVGIVMIKAQEVLRDGVSVILWLGVFVGLVAAGVWLAWVNRRSPKALTGLCWFALGFLPFSFATLFRPGHGMMIEPHWFIFPVIGFFIFIATVIEDLWQTRYQKMVMGSVSFIVAVWIITTIMMNAIWDGDINYCRYWVAESPGFSAPTFYLSMAYQVNGHYAQARYWYKKTLALGYKPEVVYLDLGFLDIMESRWTEAKEHLNKALAIDPYVATAVSDLGIISFEEKDYPLAEKYFLRAISIDRFAELPRLNLGKVYLMMGKATQAIQTFEDILVIIPNDEMALKELMMLYWDQGDHAKALNIGQRLVEVSHNPALLAQVGMMAQKEGNMGMAMQIYNRLMKIAPHGQVQGQDSLPGVTGLISAKTI